jgi:membrane protease subunit HflK
MPWNDNANPGPWGAPPSGDDGRKSMEPQPPRREGPRRGPPSPPGGPDLEALIRRLREQLGELFRGPGGRGLSGSVFGLMGGVVFAGWVLTGFYIVEANEQAVITRFGAYDRSVGPGLHFHLPIPIEQAELVQVTNQNQTSVGGNAQAPAPDESLMLTGDENIVDLSFTVQWHVSDAALYLFKVKDSGDASVKAVAESAMREVVGRTPLKSILTNGRGDVQTQTAALMQRILDHYQAGVSVDAVQIQTANPPAEVVPAYQDIAKAGQDAQSAVNDANTYRNRVVNEAKGNAAKLVQAGEGYRAQVTQVAQGEAARFNQIYAEYRKAPAVTRQRLYLETMQTVLAKSHKVIVDAKGANAPIILPPDAFRATPPEPAAQPPAAQSADGSPR